MNTYYTTDFDGHWPVGSCAIAVAANKKRARVMLRRAIVLHGLPAPKRGFKVTRLVRGAVIALDGDY